MERNKGSFPYLFPFRVTGLRKEKVLQGLADLDLIYWVNLDICNLPVRQLLNTRFFSKVESIIPEIGGIEGNE